jgi:hypothetical protein
VKSIFDAKVFQVRVPDPERLDQAVRVVHLLMSYLDASGTSPTSVNMANTGPAAMHLSNVSMYPQYLTVGVY